MDLGVHEAANAAHATLAAIRQAIADGSLVARRRGKSWRIREADVRIWAAARRKPIARDARI